MKPLTTDSRIHYMDQLRAYAMLLGVFFHAAIAYGPLMKNLWIATDPDQTVLMDGFAWFTHVFRMPLFFLIAGFFTCMLIEKRGVKQMLIHRGKRILLPMLLLGPCILLALVSVVDYAVDLIEVKSPALTFAENIRLERGNPRVRTAHLWFLYYLCFFIPLSALFHRFGVFRIAQNFINRFPRVFLLLFPLLLVPALFTVNVPHPAPLSLMPALWPFGFYGVFFLLGFILYSNRQVIDNIHAYWLILLVVGMAAYLGFFYQLPLSISRGIPLFPSSGAKLGIATLEAFSSAYLTLGFLLLGKKYLDQSSRLTRYISDASYWIYLIHLPVLFFIQFSLMEMELGPVLKFLIASLGTIVIGVISYMLLVRWTPIGAFLNGKRKPIW